MQEANLNWTCDQCGHPNEADTWPCDKCRYPLVHNKGQCRKHVRGQYQDDKVDQARELAEEKKWYCSHCKYVNPSSAKRCEKCFADKKANKAAFLQARQSTSNFRRSMENLFPAFHTKDFQDQAFHAQELKESIPVKGDKWKNISNALFRDESLSETITVKDLIDASNSSDIAGSIVLHNNDADQTVSGVLFRVLAPHAEKVAVVGEWNDWNPDEDYLYRETDDFWQTVVPNARPGQLYNYIIQFHDNEKDQTVSVFRADPRGQILRFHKKRWCSEIYDLKSFKWADRRFKGKKFNDLILYEVHVGTWPLSGCSQTAFNESQQLERIGTFKEVQASIPHFLDLGINCIALMPITQDSHHAPFNCWGYDPVSLWAVHTDYGTPDDLKELINACHVKGISVLCDFVPNHFAEENVLNFFDGPEDLYFPHDISLKATPWGPRPNFASPRVRRYCVDAVEFWLREFHFDGVRVDSTCNIRMFNQGGQNSMLPDGYIFLQEMNDMVHLKFPHKITIAEDLQDPFASCNHGGAGFDVQWDDVFFKEVLRTVIATSDGYRNMHDLARGICEPALAGSPAGGRIIFTESHDTVPSDRQGRIPAAILRGHRMNWPNCRDVESNFFSQKRTALSLAILLTSPGIPMLLQGQEFFETCSPMWPHGPLMDRTREERLDPPDGFFKLISRLCDLRMNITHTTRGLTGYYARAFHVNNSDNKVLAYHRWVLGGATDDVIVIVNCSNVDYEEYYLGFPRFGDWHLRFNSDSKEYCSSFSNFDVSSMIEVTKDPKDGYPFCGRVRIPSYSVLVYSQDAISTVRFTLDAEVGENYRLFLTGSSSSLGQWNIHEAIEMKEAGHRDIDTLYKSPPVTVSFGQAVEFKFFLVEDLPEGHYTKQQIRWQIGENNVFRADNSNRRYQVDCKHLTFEDK